MEVDEDVMPDRGKAQPSRRRQARTEQPNDRRTSTMKLYNDFMKVEMKRLRLQHPELAGKEHHQTIFKKAAGNWADATTNPKNALAEDGAAVGGSGSGRTPPADETTAAEAGGEEAVAEGVEDGAAVGGSGSGRGNDRMPPAEPADQIETEAGGEEAVAERVEQSGGSNEEQPEATGSGAGG